MEYLVELAVCYEDSTWALQNVRVKVRGNDPSDAKIWQTAVEEFYRDLDDGCAVVALGLYHYQEADADE